MWQVVLFNCINLFFSFLDYSPASSAITKWVDADHPKGLMVRRLAGDSCFVVTIWLWKKWFINASWRRSTVVALTWWLVTNYAATVLVSLDVTRNEWVFLVLQCMRCTQRTFVLLGCLVLATELSEMGSEGLSHALFNSFNGISTSVISEVSKALAARYATLNITSEDVTKDESSTRMTVLWCLTVVFALNLCALAGVFWLPQQKLDAQQLRVYGGYNARVAAAIALTYLAGLLCAFYHSIKTLCQT